MTGRTDRAVRAGMELHALGPTHCAELIDPSRVAAVLKFLAEEADQPMARQDALAAC